MGPLDIEPCCRQSCDRYVTPAIRRDAERQKMHFVWADLMTSKCGFVPREGER